MQRTVKGAQVECMSSADASRVYFIVVAPGPGTGLYTDPSEAPELGQVTKVQGYLEAVDQLQKMMYPQDLPAKQGGSPTPARAASEPPSGFDSPERQRVRQLLGSREQVYRRAS